MRTTLEERLAFYKLALAEVEPVEHDPELDVFLCHVARRKFYKNGIILSNEKFKRLFPELVKHRAFISKYSSGVMWPHNAQRAEALRKAIAEVEKKLKCKRSC